MTTAEIIKKIKKCDLLIVIPSKNTAHGIKTSAQAALAGVIKYFPNLDVAIVNLDSSSQDQTPKVFKEAISQFNYDEALVKKQKVFTASIQVPDGKGAALREGLVIANKTGAKCMVTVDADLRSITPEWIDRLARPVLEYKTDFIVPYYVRHKYNATITNSLIYPLTRVVYKKELRQPIGGEFALSSKLVRKLISLEPWPSKAYQFGVDIFFTTTALRYFDKVSEAFLGVKNHDPKDPALHLGPMFDQVISTMFEQMKNHYDYWSKLRNSPIKRVLRYGLPFLVVAEPVDVNVSRLIRYFRNGVKKNQDIYKKFFSPKIFQKIIDVARGKSHKFDIDLWADLIFESAKSGIAPNNLIPLYYGRTATFINETKKLNQEQGEIYIKKLALRFEKDSNYLYKFWAK